MDPSDRQDGTLPSRLKHVLPGQDLEPNDLRWLALELYRREHGGIWVGEMLTAQKMNIVVDWWNGQRPMGPCRACGIPYAECEISADDPDYRTDANGNHEGLCCEDCQHSAVDRPRKA